MSFQNINAPPPAPPSTRSRTPIIVLSIVFLVVVLGAGCTFLLFRSGSKSITGAKSAAERYLTLIDKKDYEASRQMLSAGATKSTSKDTMTDVLAVLQKRHGRPKGHIGPENYNIRSFNGVTYVRLLYREQFEKGSTTVDLTLTPENGEWKVERFNFAL